MSIEKCEPHETYAEACTSTTAEILGSLALFEGCDLLDIIKQATKGREDEV